MCRVKKPLIRDIMKFLNKTKQGIHEIVINVVFLVSLILLDYYIYGVRSSSILAILYLLIITIVVLLVSYEHFVKKKKFIFKLRGIALTMFFLFSIYVLYWRIILKNILAFSVLAAISLIVFYNALKDSVNIDNKRI